MAGVEEQIRAGGDLANIVQAHYTARNDVSELARLSEFLAAFGDRASLPEDFRGDLELALEEIFVNAATHGHPEGGEHAISVRISLDGSVVTLVVEDDGVPFNPLEARLVDLDLPVAERGIGGLGIHLVKGVMDELEYARLEGRNRLVMRKKLQR